MVVGVVITGATTAGVVAIAGCVPTFITTGLGFI